uniref:FecR family protein n=1 Tax=Pedobacter schmidteae TaxID=2201271 RepID=UPI000EB487C3|nr:FecR domain-containing protein [Pedobacter schmidteae]
MEQSRIIYLHQRYLNQSLTLEELKEWKAILDDPGQEPFLKELMKETWEELKAKGATDMPQERAESLFLEIAALPQDVIKRRLWPKIVTVAAAMALIVSGMYFFNYRNGQTDAGLNTTLVQDVKPGKVGATLTLANGKKIRLDDAVNGELANEAGVSISKSADGQLVYEIKGGKADPDRMNTLTTAKGETYRVRLPDGSLVYLNAASSLTYVASLNERGKRVVKLSGEGYFEIAKDKAHPFVVKTDRQEVEVLGTHFNVNAYGDEAAVRTTLLEGSVRVSSGETRQVLKPGFQAVNDGRLIKVAEVNTENVVDWKDGDFYFENVDFRSVMRKIGRWYDVELVYDSSVPDRIASNGVISRDKDLSAVLKLIESSGQVHFRIEGRKVYITK